MVHRPGHLAHDGMRAGVARLPPGAQVAILPRGVPPLSPPRSRLPVMAESGHWARHRYGRRDCDHSRKHDAHQLCRPVCFRLGAPRGQGREMPTPTWHESGWRIQQTEERSWPDGLRLVNLAKGLTRSAQGQPSLAPPRLGGRIGRNGGDRQRGSDEVTQAPTQPSAPSPRSHRRGGQHALELPHAPCRISPTGRGRLVLERRRLAGYLAV